MSVPDDWPKNSTECEQFRFDPNHNPFTKRRIVPGSRTYDKLVKICGKPVARDTSPSATSTSATLTECISKCSPGYTVKPRVMKLSQIEDEIEEILNDELSSYKMYTDVIKIRRYTVVNQSSSSSAATTKKSPAPVPAAAATKKSPTPVTLATGVPVGNRSDISNSKQPPLPVYRLKEKERFDKRLAEKIQGKISM